MLYPAIKFYPKTRQGKVPGGQTHYNPTCFCDGSSVAPFPQIEFTINNLAFMGSAFKSLGLGVPKRSLLAKTLSISTRIVWVILHTERQRKKQAGRRNGSRASNSADDPLVPIELQRTDYLQFSIGLIFR